jgi:predicted cupin superfamily sugar epimerase
MTPKDIIETLALAPHPEGGWYRETWRAGAPEGARAAGTAIYYLLERNQISHWHRIDAAEIWHWYAGSALDLFLSMDGLSRQIAILGSEIQAGERPQIMIPAGCWQSAISRGEFTLVGCTVIPGFEFRGFEMAPADWQPLG